VRKILLGMRIPLGRAVGLAQPPRPRPECPPYTRAAREEKPEEREPLARRRRSLGPELDRAVGPAVI